MAIQTKEQLEETFSVGKFPTQQDYYNLIDTIESMSSGSSDISELATVATTGNYNDLLNRPTLFSGNYNDLTNKPTLFSGSYDDLTNKPTLFSGDYTDLTNKPTIPTNLSDLFDDNTHRLVTDTEKTAWNNKSDFSGSYNDLTNKPTIPTVPTISTNITSDATSDTKTASPKAVKDFVEGKGYLTQHQDISGKADQSDLESLEDRVEVLEQSGGGASITIDSELSSTSEHALQNKVLYDELRVTESSSSTALTVNGTNYPIVELDANQFNSTSWNEDGTDYSAVVIPTLDENKAYYITNVSDYDSYVFENSGEFILKFDNNPRIFGNRTEFGTHTWANSWISIPINIEIQDDDYTYYYGDSVYYDNATPLTSATETQVSGTPIVKSLKQKIEELESNISVDSELSSVSEKALQNKVLYDELRITSGGNVSEFVTYNETEYPVIVLDANTFSTITDNGQTLSVIPNVDYPNKAYSIVNSNGKKFVTAIQQYENDAPIIFKFDAIPSFRTNGDNPEYITLFGQSEVNQFVGIYFPYWNQVEDASSIGSSSDFIDISEEISVRSETTPSSNVSLKAKIIELEQRIAELEARITQISA